MLPELGVRLEDKENHTVIKLVDKNELKREMEQLKIAEEKKKAEKEKKKAEADANADGTNRLIIAVWASVPG